jgi:hypothetical protein
MLHTYQILHRQCIQVYVLGHNLIYLGKRRERSSAEAVKEQQEEGQRMSSAELREREKRNGEND